MKKLLFANACSIVLLCMQNLQTANAEMITFRSKEDKIISFDIQKFPGIELSKFVTQQFFDFEINSEERFESLCSFKTLKNFVEILDLIEALYSSVPTEAEVENELISKIICCGNNVIVNLGLLAEYFNIIWLSDICAKTLAMKIVLPENLDNIRYNLQFYKVLRKIPLSHFRTSLICYLINIKQNSFDLLFEHLIKQEIFSKRYSKKLYREIVKTNTFQSLVPRELTNCAMSFDRKTWALVDNEKKVVLLDATNFANKKEILTKAKLKKTQFSNDSSYLAVITEKEQPMLIDIETRICISMPVSKVKGLCISDDSNYIVTRFGRQSSILWDLSFLRDWLKEQESLLDQVLVLTLLLEQQPSFISDEKEHIQSMYNLLPNLIKEKLLTVFGIQA